MAGVLKYIMLTVYFVGSISCDEIPLDKCKLDDPACMVPAFQVVLSKFMGGVPDWGVEVLDPLVMDKVVFDMSGLKFSFRDGRLKGLKGATINKVKWDLRDEKLLVDFSLDAVVKGHYTAAGMLLVLPISGDGQMKVRLRNVHITLYIYYRMIRGVDDRHHVKPREYDFDFEVVDNADFHLTGLFNGNEVLSNTMLTFLNENWQEVSQQFGRPMIDVVASKLFKNVDQFFDHHAIEDIAIVKVD